MVCCQLKINVALARMIAHSYAPHHHEVRVQWNERGIANTGDQQSLSHKVAGESLERASLGASFKLKEVGFASNKDNLWASGPRRAFHCSGHILGDDSGLDQKLTGQMKFFI